MSVDTSKYNNRFYNQHWRRVTAGIILSKMLKILPETNSAVDFGCGLGIWLAVLRKLGVKEIKGYDGNWIDKETLEIPKACFTVADLSQTVSVEKRYDLAISIEVAEHLPEKSAKIFVETLTKASDIVLFSAAIPWQRGVNHINEQWQGYWYKLFHEFGYIGMDIRSLIWNDSRIGVAQRQNIMLYVKKDKVSSINISEKYYRLTDKYINFVHPELYLKRNVWVVPLFELYKIAIKRTIKKLTFVKLYNLKFLRK